MKHFIVKKPIIAVFILLTVILGIYFVAFKGKVSAYNFVAVKKGAISEEVLVTGKTKPAQSFNLGLERGGRISWVNAKVGNEIFAGQTLVALDSGDFQAQLQQAQADLATQKSKLDELKRGARPEDISIQETSLANAQTALENAKQSLVNTLQDSYTRAEDTIQNKIDQFISNPRGLDPQINFVIYDGQLKTDIQNKRAALEFTLSSWRNDLDKLSLSDNFAAYINLIKTNLDQIRLFLDKTAVAVNSLTPSSPLTQTVIDSYKADVSSGRTNINTATANLSAAQEKLATSQANMLLAEKNLALKKAGATSEEITQQEAQVSRAEAGIKLIQAQIAKGVLSSPINGIITKQDAKVGEVSSPGIPLITVMSESSLEIEANIPEVDIVKIAVGNPVTIILDALAQETFLGKLAYIDPAETITDGVVNFKVKIIFEKADPRIKSGLTANLKIQTLTKNNTLILPQFTIIENDAGTFVRRKVNSTQYQSSIANLTSSENKVEEIPVKTGIRNQDGLVEIISGLNEGDQIANIGFKSK